MKRILAILTAAAVILIMAACSSMPGTSTPPSKPAEGDSAGQTGESPFKVGFVMLEAKGNNYNIMTELQKACEERGWDFVYESYDQDYEKSISVVQNFILQGCDALFIYTVDAGNMATLQAMCDDAGVGCAFTGLMEEGYIQLCDDEYNQGVFGAEKLIEGAQEKWDGAAPDLLIVAEATEVGDGNRIRMHEALVPRLMEEYPNLTEDDICWVDCGLDLLKASSEIANILSAHPDAEHIMIPTFIDESGAQGAMNALESAGRTDQALLMTYHISDDVTVNYIKTSESYLGSCYFPPSAYVGPLCDNVLAVWEKGGSVEPHQIYSAYEWITSENIDEYQFSFQQK